MGIELDPDFIMQDHCGASLNGARSAGMDSTILMCYFHVPSSVTTSTEKGSVSMEMC